jgi:hypothetical protein
MEVIFMNEIVTESATRAGESRSSNQMSEWSNSVVRWRAGDVLECIRNEISVEKIECLKNHTGVAYDSLAKNSIVPGFNRNHGVV